MTAGRANLLRAEWSLEWSCACCFRHGIAQLTMRLGSRSHLQGSPAKLASHPSTYQCLLELLQKVFAVSVLLFAP